MKKKALILAAMLSVLLFSFGTAHAVLGVADDVPGTDVVFPIICEKGGTMNTLWAIADVWAFGGGADLIVLDRKSVPIYDDEVEWTYDDVDIISGDCQSLVAMMSPAQKAALERTIGGKTYYIGYIVFLNWYWPYFDYMVPWVYLVDLTKGFASGFNGFAAEYFLSSTLCENGVCPSAYALFPRYLLLNNLADTWNWWIILMGSNASTRVLSGWICNEDEDCISLDIPIPDELNIIDVAYYLPAGLHPGGFPKAGMGWFFVAPYNYNIGTFGWAYQRAAGSSLAATWDVIHPMHRLSLLIDQDQVE